MRRLAIVGLLLGACHEPDVVTDETPAPEMGVGESRVVELRYLRLDVEDFKKTNTLEQLRAMPRRVLEDIWVLDLDCTQLMINSLEQLRTLPDEEVDALTPAAQNMRRLLLMTPDSAELEGTNLEELIALSASVGIPPAHALANLIGRDVSDPFIPIEVVAQVMLEDVIGSHPNAQFRRGPVDEDHPDGMWPVAKNSLPVTMADVVTNFENMAERFGPIGDHPGFILEAHGVSVIEDEFAMTSYVNANALPYKGIDATNGESASVNSIGGQIETVHDFSDPNWLQLDGLVKVPIVEKLVFGVVENDGYVPGGTSREPAPFGGSPGWDLPTWEFERLILRMAQLSTEETPAHCDDYELGTGVVAFSGCIEDDGWVTLETFDDVGAPPEPAYMWDLELEISQARLHDGGLAEGEADIALALSDVEVGVPPEEVVAQVRTNIEANPEALREFAALLTDSTVGNADFFYVRGIESLPADQQGDWLYFVHEDDIAIDDDGQPVRDYGYATPGFFSDAGLTRDVSTTELVDGDELHLKVRIEAGDELFFGDDDGRVYRIAVLEKPSRARIALEITRVE
jgi:hypothetical protein